MEDAYTEEMQPLFLVKYGELALKGENRPYFEKTLVNNIRAALAAWGVESPQITRANGRIFAKTQAHDQRTVDAVLEALRHVFGIVETSLAYRVSADIREISHAAVILAKEATTRLQAASKKDKRTPGVTFKVAARRADKSFPLDSPKINAILGEEILDQAPGLSVNVTNPDFIIVVEVRREGVFVYYRSARGPGGLPIGVSGRVLLLLSGGIDSPVAGWLSMKRGLIVGAIHFDSYPLTTQRAKEKVFDLCKILSRWQLPAPVILNVVRFTPIQEAIWERCIEDLRVTVMRRLMIKIADVIAQRSGLQALVTGESLGQVASQTLDSIAVTNKASELPVLRPLVGFDKTEITTLAKEIGTFTISIRPYDDCCTIFVPRHPATRPDLETVLEMEDLIGADILIKEAVETVVTHRFGPP